MQIESRLGLNKQKVKLARQKLLAKQQYPSVDAVRIELGNTGSKTTIHKYLKELEQEEGEQNTPSVGLSETLQNFVAQLAKQLQLEADEKIESIKNQYEQQHQEDLAQLTELKERENQLTKQVHVQDNMLTELTDQHQQLQQNWQAAQIEHSRMTQQIADLNQQVLQHQQYKAELLDKFNHAQTSLEHYRASVKEQRQQDLRRHDSAVHHLQNEIKQLQQTIVIEHHQNTVLQQEQIKQQSYLEQLQKQHQDDAIALKAYQQQLENMQQQSQVLLLQQQKLEQERQVLQLNLESQLEKINSFQSIEEKNKTLEQQVMVLNTELNIQQKLYHEVLHALSATSQHDKGST